MKPRRFLTVEREDRPIYIACIALWVVIFFVVVPRLAPLLPAFWWLDVRDVRVDNQSTIVTIDRDIKAHFFDKLGEDANGNPQRFFFGDVALEIRQVSGTGPRSTCRGGRRGSQFRDGNPFPVRELTLDWFLDSPPNAGCRLANGDYVADFTWTRRFLGLTLRTRKSSNIFHIGPPVELSE